MNKKIIFTGLILLITGIVLGAFGAHALKKALLDFPEKIISFETGVRYQMYGAFSFLILGLNAHKFSFNLKLNFSLLLLGHLLFSLSIYGLAIMPLLKMNFNFLGPLTPIGGALIILSWSLFLVKFLKNK
ncbi:MAG: DUF423 domain-containing protein [Flavobacteriia bacterium]|nr:DUF423 domain-containing protein [Flavobacteriia bacterium]